MDNVLDIIRKKHITPKLLQFLADSYEFECDGECLATWKFFYEGVVMLVSSSHARLLPATATMSLLRTSTWAMNTTSSHFNKGWRYVQDRQSATTKSAFIRKELRDSVTGTGFVTLLIRTSQSETQIL